MKASRVRDLYWDAYTIYRARGQAAYPFAPLETIARDQSRRVRSIISHAYRRVPYYRETMDRLGLRPSDFRCADDLGKLPILDNGTFGREIDRFLARPEKRSRYLELCSGGSTGAPRTVYHDARAMFESAISGARKRAVVREWAGKRFGLRETVITHPRGSLEKIYGFYREHSLFDRFSGNVRQFLSMLDPIEENARRLNAFEPDVLIGYGSYFDALFPYLVETGKPFHRPKLVIYSSDRISDPVRSLIQHRLGVPVVGAYCATEAFDIGFGCGRHEGVHLNIDLYPIRILDQKDRPVGPEESGEVIVSNLVNRACVVLNYRIGDLAAMLGAPCVCGRSLPLLSRIEGRSDDWLDTDGGGRLHPQAVHTILKNVGGVWRYQVVQRSTTRFSVVLVTAGDCDRRSAEARIRAGFREKFGDRTAVDIAYADSLSRNRSGKTRTIVGLGRADSPGPG